MLSYRVIPTQRKVARIPPLQHLASSQLPAHQGETMIESTSARGRKADSSSRYGDYIRHKVVDLFLLWFALERTFSG